MANKKASQKSISQTIAHTARNRSVRSKLKTLNKKVLALEPGTDAAKRAAAEYASELDKAVKKNVIHSNAANRRKSGLSKFVFAS